VFGAFFFFCVSEHTFGCSESSSFSFFWPATLPEKIPRLKNKQTFS